MRHWFLKQSLHLTDIQSSQIGQSWSFHGVPLNHRLNPGDVVYLVGPYGDVYGWGLVSSMDNEERLMRLTITFHALRDGLVSSEKVGKESRLKPLFLDQQPLIELTPPQVEALNRLLRTQGARAPSESIGNDSYFVRGQTVAFEETRHVELKEIKTTTRAVDSVKNTVDEYVVAFLNIGQPGSIFWGIRDSDCVVMGARFNTSERDSVRREAANKLSQIQPHIDASLIRQHFHQVFNEDRDEIPDLFVLEVEIPAASAQELYATQSGEVYMKTDGGRRKLNHLQIIAEIQKRKCGQLDSEMFRVVADLTRRFQTNSGNVWCPPVGSSDHKLAEMMAIKGMLVRTSPGAYALPHVLPPDQVA